MLLSQKLSNRLNGHSHAKEFSSKLPYSNAHKKPPVNLNQGFAATEKNCSLNLS